MNAGEAVEIESSYGRVVAGGSMIEAIGCAAAIVLAIIGLSGILQPYMTAVAVIAIGASLLFEGGTVGARFSRLLATRAAGTFGYAGFGGGMTAEFLAGAAGIILGLLALLGIAQAILPPVAVIVFGGALLIGSGPTARLSFMENAASGNYVEVREVAREAVCATSGAQVLTGLAAAILGILALVGFSAMILTLVALLCVGAAVVINGSAISGRILSLLS